MHIKSPLNTYFKHLEVRTFITEIKHSVKAMLIVTRVKGRDLPNVFFLSVIFYAFKLNFLLL